MTATAVVLNGASTRRPGQRARDTALLIAGAGGIAVGRSVRLSIVSTAILDFFLTLVIFGTDTSVRVAG